MLLYWLRLGSQSHAVSPGKCVEGRTPHLPLWSPLNSNCAFVSCPSSLRYAFWTFLFTFLVSVLPETKWDYGEIGEGVSDRGWMCSSTPVPSYNKFDRQERKFFSIRTGPLFNFWSGIERNGKDSKQRESGSSTLFQGLSGRLSYSSQCAFLQCGVILLKEFSLGKVKNINWNTVFFQRRHI